MIVVGNGRVGKTSMVKRLMGIPYDPKEKFTHGISLGELEQEHLEKIEAEDFKMSVWDFGGQEIFYAAHQFFMTDSALYLLAWTNRVNLEEYKKRMLEENEEVEFGEKWREEQVWLENIQAYTKEAPIIMVQTHADKFDTQKVPVSAFGEAPYNARFCNFSAAADMGLIQLKHMIADQLRQLPYFGAEYPQTYDNVIQAIGERRLQQPVLSRNEFYEICESANVDKENYDDLLGYLNRTGICVHYATNDALKDKIFIDPAWITKCVYAILNKQLKIMRGSMKLSYIEERLQQQKIAEIDAQGLIELLKSFKLIFETEEQNEESNQPEKIYIYPDYLPDILDSAAMKLFRRAKRNMSIAFHLGFINYLPENVLINIISHYGPDTTDDVVWKNGIYFTTDQEEEAIIEFDPESGIFTVFTPKTPGAVMLQREICHRIKDLGRNTAIELALDLDQGFISWEALSRENIINHFNTKQDPENFEIFNSAGVAFKYYDFCHLIFEGHALKMMQMQQDLSGAESENPAAPQVQLISAEQNLPTPATRKTETTNKPAIYFSYAWQDEDNPDRELLVNDLYNALTGVGFNIKRDKEESGYGEYIDEFMREIGNGDLILVFLSKKYLRSLNCMSELFYIARKRGWDKQEFGKRILPIVVEPISFKDSEKVGLLEYWWAVREAKEKYRMTRGLRADSIRKIDETIEMSMKVDDLLNWLENLNRGNIDLYEQDNYQAIKTKIKERLSKTPYFQSEQNDLSVFMEQFKVLNAKLSDLELIIIRQFESQFGTLSIKMDQLLAGVDNLEALHEDQQALLQQLSTKVLERTSTETLEQVNDKIDQLIQTHLKELPTQLVQLWQEAQQKSAMDADVKGKLKFKFNIIPFFAYEKEISLDLKKVFKEIIGDIKNGNIFLKDA